MTAPPASDAASSRWRLLGELLTRPYPVNLRVVGPMIVLAALVPGYLIAAALTTGRALHMPALPLDLSLPVRPGWALVYLSLYIACFLPLVVLRDEEQIRRTLFAYILVWLAAFSCFMLYPTVLPRPSPHAIGEGFSAWVLRLIYAADAPFNCFPCLHVAQPILAALVSYRVSRGVGVAALVWAALVLVSTLYTKQHYVADNLAALILAGAAYTICFWNYPRSAALQLDRRLAPLIVGGFVATHLLLIVGLYVAYRWR